MDGIRETPAPTWQPIETAPKDGTAVVLCWAIDADGYAIDWSLSPSTAGVFVQVASWWTGENVRGSWMVYCDLISEPRLHFEPTHWMPLPPPPMSSWGHSRMPHNPNPPS